MSELLQKEMPDWEDNLRIVKGRGVCVCISHLPTDIIESKAIGLDLEINISNDCGLANL